MLWRRMPCLQVQATPGEFVEQNVFTCGSLILGVGELGDGGDDVSVREFRCGARVPQLLHGGKGTATHRQVLDSAVRPGVSSLATHVRTEVSCR